MCGLFGAFFKDDSVSEGQRAILSYNLACRNDDRGGDSWGAMGIDFNGKPQVIKGLGDFSENAHNLVDFKKYLAHTRFATKGDKTIQNAHPFTFGPITGAHNGVVWNHDELNKKYNRNFEVDSMHLFAHLNEYKKFSKVEGYGSITWYNDQFKNRIYLCRLLNGELHVRGIGKPNNCVGVVWSSNKTHLLESLKISGIKQHFPYRIIESAVYFIENGKLFTTNWTIELKRGFSKTRYFSGSSSVSNNNATMTRDEYERWWKKSLETKIDNDGFGNITTFKEYCEKKEREDDNFNQYWRRKEDSDYLDDYEKFTNTITRGRIA